VNLSSSTVYRDFHSFLLYSDYCVTSV